MATSPKAHDPVGPGNQHGELRLRCSDDEASRPRRNGLDQVTTINQNHHAGEAETVPQHCSSLLSLTPGAHFALTKLVNKDLEDH
jgi:hypothetical protein